MKNERLSYGVGVDGHVYGFCCCWYSVISIAWAIAAASVMTRLLLPRIATGAGMGALLGAALGGEVGLVLGAFLGAILGLLV